MRRPCRWTESQTQSHGQSHPTDQIAEPARGNRPFRHPSESIRRRRIRLPLPQRCPNAHQSLSADPLRARYRANRHKKPSARLGRSTSGGSRRESVSSFGRDGLAWNWLLNRLGGMIHPLLIGSSRVWNDSEPVNIHRYYLQLVQWHERFSDRSVQQGLLGH